MTVVSGFDQAIELIERPWNIEEENFQALFDVVLTDCMFPKGGDMCMGTGYEAKQEYLTKEMPYGPMVVFKAIQVGIKYIGLITMGNHHKDPFVFALDEVNGFKSKKLSVVITNYCSVASKTEPAIQVKNWKRLLELVLDTCEEINEYSGQKINAHQRSI